MSTFQPQSETEELIKRLEAEPVEYAVMSEAAEQLRKLDAENARLRRALDVSDEDILDRAHCAVECGEGCAQVEITDKVLRECLVVNFAKQFRVLLARAALKGEGE